MGQITESLYQAFFKAAPCKILVLHADSAEIIAVTNGYLSAISTSEKEVLGKSVFDIFPYNLSELQKESGQNLKASFLRVKTLKVPDAMKAQHYSMNNTEGVLTKKIWSAVNTPLLGDAGEVAFIMHSVEDISGIMDEVPQIASITSNQISVSQVLRYSQELKALSKLQEHEARAHTAERMLGLGAWEFNPANGQLYWSESVFDIYGVPHRETAPNFDEYFSLLHPGDRQSSLDRYHDFVVRHAKQIEFHHRVITRDGSTRYIQGVGERYLTSQGELVLGYVLDVTARTKTEQLLRLAGEKVQLGGWRVELDSGKVIWTPETAAIHDMPSSYSPSTVKEALSYYMLDYREMIQRSFESCVQTGSDFDVTCRLLTPLGRQPWVRAIGVAEYDEKGKVIAVQGAFQDVSILHDVDNKVVDAETQRLNLLESISDAFFALDSEWCFTYLNQKAEVVVERSREGLLGRNIWQEFPSAVGTVFDQQYHLAVNEGITTQFESFYPPLNKWLDVTAYPIPEGLAVHFRDITENRERQEQLRLVEAALARQNDIVMITEADQLDEPYGPRIVYVNDAFERLTGYSKEEVIGRTPRMLQGLGSDREQLAHIRRALESKTAVRCEVLNYNKVGQPYWLELDITPLLDDKGHCSHFVAVERDITERKQKDGQLRIAQERFELISKASHDVIWDWDFTTGAVWWNSSVKDVFGYDLASLEPGQESWTSRVHSDDLERVEGGIYEVIDSQTNYWEDEYRFITQNGKVAWVMDRAYILRDKKGKAIRMVGSMLDMTDRIEMEQKLRESQKLEAVGHLTGGVAHDFNNLLTVILGNAEMLVEMLTEGDHLEMAQMTVAAAHRGSELTKRLLAFSRRQPLNPKLTDINTVVEQMKTLIARTLPENIEFQCVLGENLGIAEVDVSELDTALLNLVINARDAMPTGGKLTIETANVEIDEVYASRHAEVASGQYVMICVSDTGTGMTKETLERAFEPFFSTKTAGKGSGLGLSMVFGYTKQSGGHIKIYSELGEGSSIKLFFPRVFEQGDLDIVLTSDRALQGGSEHILIAEDDYLVLQHLKAQLTMLGYRVSVAMTGGEALDKLSVQRDIDMLLTDIIMPGGMNGRELADKAHALYPSIKILFTSGYAENAIVHHGRLDPGVELLGKPYTRLELATKVRKVLDRDCNL
jgi:PAS domain S-box-containing protein